MKNDERRTIQVSVFDGEQYDGGWPDGTLIKVIEWFQGKLAEIPEEYRQSATCDISSSPNWGDSHCGRIEIDYWRPETDEEMQARLAEYKAEAERNRSQELATLAALEAKYRKQT